MKLTTVISAQETTSASDTKLKESHSYPYCAIPQRTGLNLSMTWVRDTNSKLVAYWS